MEDAFTLIVLTLLQLCRAEISKPVPEWYAANLINDASYTPKPITEIFTTDLSFTPIDQFSPTPATVFPTPPPTTTTSTASASTTIIQNEDTTTQEIPLNAPFEVVQISQPQKPIVFSQTANRPSNSDPPQFVIIYDPRQGPLLPSQTSTTTEDNRATVTQPPIRVSEIVAQETTVLPNVPIPVGREPLGANQMLMGYLGLFNNNTGSGVQTTTDLPPAVPASLKPMITVRVKSRKGAVTNILINPSTTSRPSTTRRRKTNQRRNNYQICLSSCSETREPICASPAGIFPINPDKLKGFPSLCHMACNNSFRNNQMYDKVTDGRCGKLRTRIRPVDKNKLNREELNKAQYTILHNGPETVMEFSPLSS